MFFYQDSSALQTEKTISLIELIQNSGIGGMLIIGLLFFFTSCCHIYIF
jgi:hypothetical protein